MYYTNSRLIWPNSILNAEFRLPESAQLQGLTYDYSDHSLVTYDAVEKKLMWISRDDASVRASAEVATDVHEVLGMCQFDNILYILSYEGDGHAAVFTGSLLQARENYVVNLTRHPLPYNTYVPQYTTLWDRTHETTLKYMRYHPDFCNIFNIGPAIYLILGVASTVTKDTTPSELGQYLVEFELNGMMRYHTRLDYASRGYRWNSMPTVLNGTAVAAAFHDGCVDLLCRDMSSGSNEANILHTLMYTGASTTPVKYESSWYMSDHTGYNTDMLCVGRYMYTLINNRIYRSEVTMLKVEMEDGWPNTQTVDLGNMCPNQTVYRSVTIRNTAPVTTYSDIIITSRDPLLVMSLEKSYVDTDYSTVIKYMDKLAPGDKLTFYIRLTAPNLVEGSQTPYQYLSKIDFHPNMKVEYEKED